MRKFCFFAVLSFAAAAWSQSVVYDNTTTFLSRGIRMLHTLRTEGAEMGDEVRLAGAEREVVGLRLRFWYGGTTPATFDAKIRLRSISRDRRTPGKEIIRNGKAVGFAYVYEPAGTLYESDIVVGLRAEPGMNEYSFKIPHVKVPDRFIWTIQTYNGKGLTGDLGPAYYNAPTVGSSDDYFWQSENGSPWIPYSWGADPYCNFGARILAVGSPKPRGPVVPPSR